LTRHTYARYREKEGLSQQEAEAYLEQGYHVMVHRIGSDGEAVVARLWRHSEGYCVDDLDGEKMTEWQHGSPHAAIEAAKKALKALPPL
jgi:hypothetical protein